MDTAAHGYYPGRRTLTMPPLGVETGHEVEDRAGGCGGDGLGGDSTPFGTAFQTEVDSVAAGVIMDVSPTKILYRDPDFTPGGTLHIKDRATGAVEDVSIVPNRYPVRAYLSPHGAIFTGGTFPNYGLFEWRDGTLIDHGVPSTETVLRASGNYATWSTPGGPGQGQVVHRRDLAAGTTSQIATGASNTDLEVWPNGDVYWHTAPDPDIFRWRDGVTEQLTNDAYWNYTPLTDGTNVAYTKAVPNAAGFGLKAAALRTATGEEILLEEFHDDDRGSPRYDVAGGWAAFHQIRPADRLEVWRRSPAGDISKVSPPGGDWVLRGMGPNGDVWLGHVFLARVGQPLIDLGDSALGDTRWARGVGGFTFMDGNRWFLAKGNTVYEVTTGYPRPRGATPTRYSLVTAYEECTSPNRTHGPPLAFQSCGPPARSSQQLTVGTGDSNGQPAKSNGHVLLTSIVGNPGTAADEADVKLEVEITDVRRADNLQDYTGELLLDSSFRVVDRDTHAEDGSTTHGTVGDLEFDFPIQCTPTADTTVGSTCSLTTTMDTGGGSFVKEGRRSIWQFHDPRVYDGGPDGSVDTLDNTLFAVPGMFVP